MREPYEISMLDVVMVLQDLPEHGLQKGDTGTVVEMFDDGALMVDFSDPIANVECIPVLQPEQVRLYWRAETERYVSARDALRDRLGTLSEEDAAAVLEFLEKRSARQEEPAA